MQKSACKLTVFFDGLFWVGVYERIIDGELAVSKITFGPEPKDYEVYEFLLKQWSGLRFSPPIKEAASHNVKINHKRLQRWIKKQIHNTGVGAKAQQGIKQQQAEGKKARTKKSRLEREQEKERRFALKQEKKKQKHKGR